MRVAVFDVQADGRIVWRADERLERIVPEQSDAYVEAAAALRFWPSAYRSGTTSAPDLLLVWIDDPKAPREVREEAALREAVARRAAAVLARRGLPLSDFLGLHHALIDVGERGVEFRWRDLAAAGDDDLLNDVLGARWVAIDAWGHGPFPWRFGVQAAPLTAVAATPTPTPAPPAAPAAPDGLPPGAGWCAYDIDECTVTIALDTPDQVHALRRCLPARGRVRLIDDAETRAAYRRRAGRARMDLHRIQLAVEAAIAEAALPWRIDEGDVAEDRCIVVRDADEGYVCEIDLREFASPTCDGLSQARVVAGLIVAAVAGRVPEDDAPEATPGATTESRADAPAERQSLRLVDCAEMDRGSRP